MLKRFNMSNQCLATICQVISCCSFFLTGLGGLGYYIFSNRVQEEKEVVQAMSGQLQSNNKMAHSLSGEIYTQLEIGDSDTVFVLGPQASDIFGLFRDSDFKLDFKNGKFLVSMKIRDQKGNIIAELTENEWSVNKNNSCDRNYSDRALEVKDQSGDIVLQMKFDENIGRVQIQAKTYDKNGRGFSIGKGNGPDGPGGHIEITGSEHPELKLKIEPLFKYPSALHFGEFVDK